VCCVRKEGNEGSEDKEGGPKSERAGGKLGPNAPTGLSYRVNRQLLRRAKLRIKACTDTTSRRFRNVIDQKFGEV